MQLIAESEPFRGFFIQARAESNQGSTASIVGVWTPLNTTMTRTATCNGVDGVSYLHTLAHYTNACSVPVRAVSQCSLTNE